MPLLSLQNGSGSTSLTIKYFHPEFIEGYIVHDAEED